ncbi:MAG TPA: hypothetical protein PK228_21860, partial [Saprospiraceae bacterium]|nr:hypothetical protein [Saprospiraceae bacterium]
MASNGEFPCYQGEINDSNKHLFTEGIREAFEFAQANPDFTAPSKKDLAAMRQYDRRIYQNVLDELFRTSTDVSLKEVLSAVLSSLPEER